MPNLQSIREKIAALLRFGNDERGNPHECETALRHAEALMRRYQIDMAEAMSADPANAPAWNWADRMVPVSERRTSNPPLWASWLVAGIGRLTDCKVTFTRRPGERGTFARFQGEEQDAEYGEWLYVFLRDNILAASATTHGTTAKESFRRGMSIRLCERMKSLRAARDEELKAAVTSTGTALVVVQTKLAKRDEVFGRQTFGRSRGTRIGDYDARMAGRAAGDRVGFGRPVGQSTQARLA